MTAADTVADLRRVAVLAYARQDICHDRAAEWLVKRDDWSDGAPQLHDPIARQRWELYAAACAWRATAWSMVAQRHMEMARGNVDAARRAARLARRAWRMEKVERRTARETV